MPEAIVRALDSLFRVWIGERGSVQDRLAKEYAALRKDFYEESNKARPDMARLDRIRFDLELLCSRIDSETGKPNAGNPS